MRKIISFIYALSLIAVALACSDGKPRNGLSEREQSAHENLLKMEQVIDENPDSAQQLLCDIVQADAGGADSNTSWSCFQLADASDYALYGLLYTEVLHKRGVKVEVDSLIRNSVDHFERSGDRRRLCKALLHRGISLMHGYRLMEAVGLMKKAEKMATDIGEDVLVYDVQMALADLNRQARCRQLMMDYYRRSLLTARLMGHSGRQSVALNKLIRAHLEDNQVDSASLYVRLAAAVSEVSERNVRAELLASEALLRLKEGRSSEAERLFRESLELIPCSFAALHLGNLYAARGNMRQACDLWAEALQTTDTDVRAEAYHHLIDFYEQHEQWRALDLSKQLNGLYLNDSSHVETEAIADLQSQFDNQLERQTLHRRIGWLVAGCLVLTAICWLLYMSWRRKKRDYHQLLRRIDDLQHRLLAFGVEEKKDLQTSAAAVGSMSVDSFSLLLDENLVYWFHRKADAARQPDHNDWLEMKALFDRYQPGFLNVINNREALSERDVHICMLIKLRFQPSEIAALVGVSPQTITNSRTRLLGKIFGEKGGARDFDHRIRQMGGSH